MPSNYQDRRYGTDSRDFDYWSKVPTAVHSWGVALKHCPCGCRAKAFSDEWLQHGGLRGFGITSKHTGQKRFPHPGEVCFWNAIPASFKMIQPPRAALCMLGQMATPLQSAWVAAHVIQGARQGTDRQAQTPEECIQSWLNRVIQEAHNLWVTESMFYTRKLTFAHEDVLSFSMVCQPTTIREIIAAEKDLQGHGANVQIFSNGVALPPFFQAHSDVIYEVGITFKRQRRQIPDHVELTVHSQQGRTVSRPLPAGTFLRHVQTWLGITGDLCLSMDSQQTRDGQRLWQSLQVQIHGAGYAGVQISDRAINTALHSLLKLHQDIENDPWVVFTPREAQLWLQAPADFIQKISGFWYHAFRRDGKILTIFEDQGHWALLIVKAEEEHLNASVFNGYRNIPAAAVSLLQRFADVWCKPCGPIGLSSLYAQQEPGQCGVIALQHACNVLGLWDRFTQTDTDTWHQRLLDLDTSESAWRAAGPTPDGIGCDLAAVLIKQGVPGNLVEARATDAIARIGAHQIQQALQHNNPWAALKALGNNAQHRFRWIQPHELQAQIEKKASHTFGADRLREAPKRDKSKAARSAPIRDVDPSSLVLQEDTFIDDSHEAVTQIPIQEVTANARGLALATISDAIPFLKAGGSISPDALGLLTVPQLPSELRGNHQVVDLQFPALYKETQEALLLSGTLINIGDIHIAKQIISLQTAIEAVDTAIIKLIGYKDELREAWPSFVSSPARAFTSQLEALNICREACTNNCRAYHPSVEEDIHKVIQDFWGRSYQKITGGKVDPAQAEMVQAFARVPQLALQQLNRESGRKGVYVEPRAESSLGPCPNFAVIWLPGKALADALHVLNTNEKAVGIARLGNKWGVRVKASDEGTVFRALRPGQTFVAIRVNAVYKIYPLPFGVQRAGIVSLLTQWQWSAKPLQPARGSAAGSAWEVGAEFDPPSFAMPGPGGDILITKVKSTQRKMEPTNNQLIPQRTRKHLQADASRSRPAHSTEPSSADPWQGDKDPWSAWFQGNDKPTAPSSSTGTTTTNKLQQIEAQLKENVHTAIQHELKEKADAMDLTEDRMGSLETTVKELCRQNDKFENWFQQAGRTTQHLNDKVSSLQTTIETQQQDLSQIRQEIQTQPQQFQESMQNALLTMGTQFNTQFQQIQEALINLKDTGHADKKPRSSE